MIKIKETQETKTTLQNSKEESALKEEPSKGVNVEVSGEIEKQIVLNENEEQQFKKKEKYEKYIKRPLDFVLSLCAILVLSPIFLVLIILGTVEMKGNPFFTQLRPGKDEKIFKLIKFRTMTCQKDENGKLLPDTDRLTTYGRILRSSSLDELPELFNILKGDMAVIGPRPLLVKYLPRYDEKQHHRHDVLPGLTGYAQAHGRNTLTWEEKFNMDVWYTQNITFVNDVKILIDTIKIVLLRDGISSENSATMDEFLGIQVKEKAVNEHLANKY